MREQARIGFVARLAADAAIRVDEKEFLARFCHDSFPTVVVRAGEHIRAHPRPAELTGAHFVLGNLEDRILGRDRQLINALRASPMIGNEHGVGANRPHQLAQRDFSATTLDGHPLPFGNRMLLCQLRVNLDARASGYCSTSSPDPARLRAGKELADDPPREVRITGKSASTSSAGGPYWATLNRGFPSGK